MSSRSHRKVKSSTVKANGRNRTLAIIGVIAVIAVLVVAVVILSQDNSGSPNVNPTSSASPTNSPMGSPNPTATPLTSPAGQYSAEGVRVLLHTSMGDITIQLRDDKPITTTNFVNLVNQGVYDGTIFHRVISNFMIQGGVNASAQLSEINDEIGAGNNNYKYTIAMAKTTQPNSASSSFFINTANNSEITYSDGTTFDGTYTVFGTVIDGTDVVDAISNVEVKPDVRGELSQPVTTITLINAEIIS
jgi:cyclophilin family peptidyl-prolyl cis-trans isomerase